MSGNTHHALVDTQFGSRAAQYLTSTPHAQGADLPDFVERMRGRPDAQVLDLGCGAGHASFAVAPHVDHVTACDLSAEMLAVVAREAAARGLANIGTRQAMAEELPFADGAFDAVVCRYSAHHWRDFAAGLRQAARVLKPGGTAVFGDAVSPGGGALDTYLQAVEVLRDPSHARNRTRVEWEAAAREAGFTCVSWTPYRVRMEFGSWVARMRTPPAHVAAIRSLQSMMAEDVRRHFAIEADGSFMLDTATMELARPG